jgi:hypothetical protein
MSVADHIDAMSTVLYGRSRSHCIKDSVCVCCGKEATEFEDSVSENEYQLTGFCQQCQDEIFGGGTDG